MKTAKAILITAMLVLVAGFAFGQTPATDTGELVLSGTVASILEITVTATANTGLNLGADVAGLQVATVLERTNNHDGYTVAISSTNIWKLKGATAEEELEYSLAYGIAGSETTLNMATPSITITDVGAKTAAAGALKSLLLAYDGSSAFLAADDYSDTITFTMTAK